MRAPRQIQKVIDGIMAANSSARQSEIKAWEEEIVACEHTLCLQQVQPKEVKSAGACAAAAAHSTRRKTWAADGRDSPLPLYAVRRSDVLGVRARREPLALPDVRLARVRPPPVWRRRRARSRAGALRPDGPPGRAQARDDHARGLGRHLLLRVRRRKDGPGAKRPLRDVWHPPREPDQDREEHDRARASLRLCPPPAASASRLTYLSLLPSPGLPAPSNSSRTSSSTST